MEDEEYEQKFVQLTCSVLCELGHQVSVIELIKAMNEAELAIEAEDQFVLEFEDLIDDDKVNILESKTQTLLCISGNNNGNGKPIGNLKIIRDSNV